MFKIRPFFAGPEAETCRGMQIDTFTGGIFDTNCFFLPETGILIDAPQETADWLTSRGHRVKLLLLTHGHIDHTWDAAQIQKDHGCRIGCHAETIPMITEREFFKKFGLGWEIDPVPGDILDLFDETVSRPIEGIDFQILLVPGHCPGSLCFLAKEARILFGGDVLFAGGVGRWDLPGGDGELLFSGIRQKLYPLGDAIKVLPGHGPATTIGTERKTNPYVGDDA
jgi:hydroxyacylglutathione hydrolase